MRNIFIFGLLALILQGGVARADAPLLVVFDINDRARALKPLDLRQLGDYMASNITESGKFRVVPMDRARDLLGQRKIRSCLEWGCQSSVGWEFKAQKVLATKLMRLGRKCVVTATLYDLQSAAAERSANTRVDCDQESLVSAVEEVTGQLTGAPAKKPRPAAAAAAPAPAPARTPARAAAPAPAPAAVEPADEPGLRQSAAPATTAPRRARRRGGFLKKPWPLWPALATAGVGVLGLGVGIPLLAIDGTYSDCQGPDRADNANCAKVYDTKLGGWMMTGLGIAGAAATGVLLTFHLLSRPKKEQDRSLKAFMVSPTSDGSGAVLGGVGEF